MKKILATILVALLPIIGMAQETDPVPIPYQNLCNMSHGNPQENVFCDTWTNLLGEQTLIRPADDTESHLYYVIMVNYNENTRLAAVSYTTMWKMQLFGNAPIIIWQNMELENILVVMERQKAKFIFSMATFDNWLPQAIEVFSNICPPCDDGGNESPVMASATNN